MADDLFKHTVRRAQGARSANATIARLHYPEALARQGHDVSSLTIRVSVSAFAESGGRRLRRLAFERLNRLQELAADLLEARLVVDFAAFQVGHVKHVHDLIEVRADFRQRDG